MGSEFGSQLLVQRPQAVDIGLLRGGVSVAPKAEVEEKVRQEGDQEAGVGSHHGHHLPGSSHEAAIEQLRPPGEQVGYHLEQARRLGLVD